MATLIAPLKLPAVNGGVTPPIRIEVNTDVRHQAQDQAE